MLDYVLGSHPQHQPPGPHFFSFPFQFWIGFEDEHDEYLVEDVLN